MAAVSIPSGSRVYLDANIFIYAAENPTAFPQLITLLKRLDAGDLSAVTSALTLAEVLVIPIRRGDKALEFSYRRRIASGNSLTVLDITRDILIKAAEIRAKSSGIKLPDAVHAATCLNVGCSSFLSNDIRIRGISELPVVLLNELP